MSLDTYTNLKAALASWVGRTDLTSTIPDCITMAESKMNRYLRTKEMITAITSPNSFALATEYTALPTDFGGVKMISLSTSPPVPLDYMSDDQMTAAYQGTSGQPQVYNIQGSNMRVAPVPDASYSVRLVYYQKVPALSGSNATNWLLTSHPDAYLYGGMGEICGFLRDFEGAQAWETAMYKVLDEVVKISKKDQYTTPLTARPG